MSWRRQPRAAYAPQVLTRGGEPYLRSAVERTVEAGGRAEEEEGASVMLGRGDDDVQWPEPDEAEWLLEHDELWLLDAAQRAHGGGMPGARVRATQERRDGLLVYDLGILPARSRHHAFLF